MRTSSNFKGTEHTGEK